MWVACGRAHFSSHPNIWNPPYLSVILLVISSVFVPLETWIVLRNFEWETMFRLPPTPANISHVVTLANLSHVISTVVGYRISMCLLKRYGVKPLIRSSLSCFTLFFVAVGLFQDTLLYAGSRLEYHRGVSSTLSDFLRSSTFTDSYIIFTVVFGTPFLCLAVVWNSGYTSLEHRGFLNSLYVESKKQVVFVNLVLILLWLSGLLPSTFSLFRLGFINLLLIIAYLGLVTPLLFSSTKEPKENIE